MKKIIYDNVTHEETIIETEEETIEIPIFFQIEELKRKLFDTDYQAIKHSEGLISEEDYVPIREQRQLWRNRINELEELRGDN